MFAGFGDIYVTCLQLQSVLVIITIIVFLLFFITLSIFLYFLSFSPIQIVVRPLIHDPCVNTTVIGLESALPKDTQLTATTVYRTRNV